VTRLSKLPQMRGVSLRKEAYKNVALLSKRQPKNNNLACSLTLNFDFVFWKQFFGYFCQTGGGGLSFNLKKKASN